MVWSVIRYFWNPVIRDWAALPDSANAARRVSVSEEKRKRIESEVFQKQRERDAEALNKERKESNDSLWMWLLSEECLRAHRELMADIGDAIAAIEVVREDAKRKEELALNALHDLQQTAIVLTDGRRAYFTRDGKRLYGEDDQEITDQSHRENAAQQAQFRADAPSYEDFVIRREARDQAAENVRRLDTSIKRLEDLAARVKEGNLTPAGLAEVRNEAETILSSLPSEARERYERLKASRNDDAGLTHRVVPDGGALPLMQADFQRAVSAASEAQSPAIDDKPVGAAPVYKAAPPF